MVSLWTQEDLENFVGELVEGYVDDIVYELQNAIAAGAEAGLGLRDLYFEDEES